MSAKGKELLQKVLDKNANAKWEVAKESGGITISRQVGADEPMYKAEVVLSATPQQVLDLVHVNKGLRLKWDSLLEKLEVLESPESDVFITHHVVKPALMGAISKRDTCDIVAIGTGDAGLLYLAAEATNHAKAPETAGTIRCEQKTGGYLLYPEDGGNKTRMVMLFDTDIKMKNAVLQIAVNMVKPTLMIEKIERLQKAIADDLK